MTTEELAAHYSVSTRAIQNWRDAGRIPFIRINSRLIRYDLDEVESALRRK